MFRNDKAASTSSRSALASRFSPKMVSSSATLSLMAASRANRASDKREAVNVSCTAPT